MMPTEVAGLQLGEREVAFAAGNRRYDARRPAPITLNFEEIGRFGELSSRPETPMLAGRRWLRIDVVPRKLQACNFTADERISAAGRCEVEDARSAAGGARACADAVKQSGCAPASEGKRDAGQ